MKLVNASTVSTRILFVIALFLISGTLLFAWTAPSAQPPLNNAPAPLTVSTSYQQKAGDLGAVRMRSNQYCDINGLNCFTPQSQQTVSCPSGQAISAINVSGTVTCVPVGGGGGGSSIVRGCGSCPGGCVLLSVGGRCTSNNDWFNCGC